MKKKPKFRLETKIYLVNTYFIGKGEKGKRRKSMFEYNGYHFEPVRKLKESEKKDICTFSKHIRSDRELGICDYNFNWKKHDYSWKGFYSASNDSQLDIFLCKENGKLYVPCEHELFQFEEKEHKLPTARK